MVNATEALSLILVGALWGCTNPFMRKGSDESSGTNSDAANQNIGDSGKAGTRDSDAPESSGTAEKSHNNTTTSTANIDEKTNALKPLSRLVRIKVWLPYLINQLGSILYYKLLASSNLTLSVPICNATAMVFSSITSVILGERLNHPKKAALGVILVLFGVAICMFSSEDGTRVDVGDDMVVKNEEL